MRTLLAILLFPLLVHAAGDESATAWGCDLTHGYIDINADYSS